jgi:hypothetical protein
LAVLLPTLIRRSNTLGDLQPSGKKIFLKVFFAFLFSWQFYCQCLKRNFPQSVFCFSFISKRFWPSLLGASAPLKREKLKENIFKA